MSEGLKKFGKGVADSTVRKAASADQGIGKQIGVELMQLGALVDELDRAEKNSTDSDTQHRVKALKGLTLVVLSAFESANGIDNEVAFRQHFADEFVLFGELVRRLEDAYESASPDTSFTEKTTGAVESAIAR